MRSPVRGCLVPAYIFVAAATCGAVRQLASSVAAGHATVAGSKAQRRGSSMSPSFSPSTASHAATADLVSSASLAGGMIGVPSVACVAIHEERKPNVCRMRLLAGSPATMPS